MHKPIVLVLARTKNHQDVSVVDNTQDQRAAWVVTDSMSQSPTFHSFAEFYDFYLQQHLNPVCKRLHVLGTITSLSLTVALLATGQWSLLWLVPVVGYSCSWTGHFVFEKNKPATFGYPLYSFWGDFRMTFDYVRQVLISKGKSL